MEEPTMTQDKDDKTTTQSKPVGIIGDRQDSQNVDTETEKLRQEKIKKRIEELRKRDPFIYR